jgi:hypothetical protein
LILKNEHRRKFFILQTSLLRGGERSFSILYDGPISGESYHD